MDNIVLIVVALGILGFGLISGRVQKSIITSPMVFVLFGLLVGPFGLKLAAFQIEHGFIHVMAEITLLLILFTDAARIDIRLLCKQHDLPIRLLIIGLPLTILFGAIIAAKWLGLEKWEAAVLATILAPTDAALGQAVVNSEVIPVRIRQALNVESGLNDGIALPVVLIFISLAGAAAQTKTVADWTQFMLMQVILGPIVGCAVGYFGGKIVDYASRTKWMTQIFQDLSALGLSIIAYALAEKVGGNGFIAAFCAGLMLGNFSRHLCTSLYEFAEAEGQLLSLLIFMIFGAVLMPASLMQLSWKTFLYAILSLTISIVLFASFNRVLPDCIKPDNSVWSGGSAFN